MDYYYTTSCHYAKFCAPVLFKGEAIEYTRPACMGKRSAFAVRVGRIGVKLLSSYFALRACIH